MVSVTLILLAVFQTAPLAHAAPPAKAGAGAVKSGPAQIPVSLFGQPCILSGPGATMAVLKAIHAISPEQTPPPASATQARGTLDRIRKQSALVPASLDRYKERLRRWFEAEAAFYDGVAEAKKSAKTDALFNAVKDFLILRKSEPFKARVSGAGATPAAWTESVVDQLKSAFDDSIEPHPEEEFHRVIEKMGIRYQCDFGDADEEGEG